MKSKQITLYGRKCAFNVQKVLWFLKELELDFNLVNMGVDITLPNNVNSWYQRLQERDGYKKWVMRDFSSLKGKKSY